MLTSLLTDVTGGDQELTPTASGVPPIKAINSTRTAPAHIQAAAAAAAKVVAEMKARQGEADEEAMPTPKGVYLWGPVGCGKTASDNSLIHFGFFFLVRLKVTDGVQDGIAPHQSHPTSVLSGSVAKATSATLC